MKYSQEKVRIHLESILIDPEVNLYSFSGEKDLNYTKLWRIRNKKRVKINDEFISKYSRAVEKPKDDFLLDFQVDTKVLNSSKRQYGKKIKRELRSKIAKLKSESEQHQKSISELLNNPELNSLLSD